MVSRFALFLAVALLAGCSSHDTSVEAYRIVLKMPRVWKAPILYVRLPENVREGHPSIDLAKALCEEFAVRVYDAFDGQVYIPEFVIVNPSLLSERDHGMCNLFVSGSLLYRNESYIGNPPLSPGRFYVAIPASYADVKINAGIMLHEWLHTFIGLGDEYKKAGEPGNSIDTSCPLDSDTRNETNSCVMYLSRYRRELCRPENHNPNTDEGKESCYAKAARVLFENRLAFIRIPTKTIIGPFDPPTPRITIQLK
jgi:hypothetical protein